MSEPRSILLQLQSVVSQHFLSSFMAGGAAGAVSRTVVSPLERLKILFQVQSAGRDAYKMSTSKALAKMWREEGWRGFMAGNGTNCIRIVPYSAVQFGSFNLYKPYFESAPDEMNSPRRLACGACSGITSVVTTYPLDIVRTRLSIQSASFAELGERAGGKKLPGMFELLVIMYKNEGGVKALYRGLIPTIAGVAPYVGLNFMAYENIKVFFTPEGQTPSHVDKLASGALAGAFAQTCTYPFDVLRRRFQVNTMPGMGYAYTSVWGAVAQILKQEGFRGMYKGIIPNLLKVAPSMAANWWTFETVKDGLRSLAPKDPEKDLKIARK